MSIITFWGNMRKVAFLLAGLMLAMTTHVARAETARLTYQIYAGGIHVVQTDMTLNVGPKNYTTDLSAFTRGFLGTLVPWRGSFASRGVRTGEGLSVREHRSVSTWRGSDDVAVYSYDAKGGFKSLKLTDEGKDKTLDKIDPALTAGTTDILTATLNMMHSAAKSGKCAGESDIFDSRRRFTLKFVSQGVETLKSTRYGVYAGPAMKCTVEVVPKGGAWHKKPRGWLSIQEQGRKKGALPTMWLASLSLDTPPVPVRIMLKTNYGTLFAHLTGAARLSGAPLYTPSAHTP